MVVASSIARTFGEKGLGIIDSSFALINLLAGLAGLGMQKIVTRELCGHDPLIRAKIRGTSFTLSMAACIVAAIAANIFSYSSPIEERLVVLGACFLLILQPFGFLINSVFEAKGRLDLIAKVLLVGLIFSTGVRLWCIHIGASLFWLALAYSFDIAVSCSLAWIIAYYFFKTSINSWKFEWATAKSLLSESLPLLLSSAAAFVYISMDTLMLKWMAGYEEVGAYGAAIRVSQIPLFLPGILAGAYTSRLMGSWLETGEFDKRDLTILSRVLLTFGTCILLGGILFGPLAVRILYGTEFSRSGPILQIHVIGVFFMIIGSLRNHLLILEGRGKLILLCDCLGAVTNLALNLYLIPHYGAMGASWATVISYFVSFILINSVHPALRSYNRLLFSAFKRNPISENS